MFNQNKVMEMLYLLRSSNATFFPTYYLFINIHFLQKTSTYIS